MPEDAEDRVDLGCDIMLEGMSAIRNISGALRAWDLKEDAERLKLINSIADALYTFDIRSAVAMGVTRSTLQRLCAEHPAVENMFPIAADWAKDGDASDRA